MIEFKFPIVCCHKEMKDIKDVYTLNADIDEEKLFICLECGNVKTYKSENLDDEVLFNLLENHEDKEIKKSKIYNELKKVID